MTRLQQSIQRLQETSAQTTARFEEELELHKQHINRLEARLERQRDYDDLKREINVLRSVDFSQIPTGEPGKSLEHLLIERTKALQQTESLKPPTTPDALGELSSLLRVDDTKKENTVLNNTKRQRASERGNIPISLSMSGLDIKTGELLLLLHCTVVSIERRLFA